MHQNFREQLALVILHWECDEAKVALARSSSPYGHDDIIDPSSNTFGIGPAPNGTISKPLSSVAEPGIIFRCGGFVKGNWLTMHTHPKTLCIYTYRANIIEIQK